jgi:hypothetical protein
MDKVFRTKRGMHTWFWKENEKERIHWEERDVCGMIILKCTQITPNNNNRTTR